MTNLPACNAVAALNVPNETSEKTVVMAADYQLCRTSHYQRLAIATAAMGVSRREIPNLLADAIYCFEGTIYWPDGRIYESSDTAVDDAFGDDDFRWLSDFIRFADQEPRQRPQRRVLTRLRLIDLYFRIKHPERARLIAQ